ncbi:hypothetical protein FDP41_007951 [Naegleria fowleri]|uniref:Myb-like domain-containing protein n=1 Tax=Naegleria fowleri TaxID=5763 RepID=A0A6A5C8E7_NAEFO|nr:uncharacterized protein FDP41_007951 [Naegleria fowleri]KAF0984036.1 hypothetical protein FDP41_007951 [Naegleria fowleri]CAG4717697.1 unnamed protein product [Naegleria fowleri]
MSSLAGYLLDKQKQVKSKSQLSSSFAPNLATKKKVGGSTTSGVPSSSNATTPTTTTTTTTTASSSEVAGVGPLHTASSTTTTTTTSRVGDPITPLQNNSLEEDNISLDHSQALSSETTSPKTIATNNSDQYENDDSTSSKSSNRKKRGKGRKRKTNDNDDENYSDDQSDSISTNSNLTSTSSTSKSSTRSKSKKLKKPTGEFKTISDFIRDAILNDYISETATNNNNANVSAVQANRISADEFVNDDDYELANSDLNESYREKIHEIEFENNSDNLSSVSVPSSKYSDFVEVKPKPSIIGSSKRATNNEENDDLEDFNNEFDDDEVEEYEKTIGPSIFSFDSEGNIKLQEEPSKVELTPVTETGRGEFNYSRAMRLANLDKNKPITQATYARRGKGERWTKEEVELFYSGLRQFGMDFSMISRLFPKRTRREIHQKYKSEEKKNKKKVEFALKNRAPIDLSLFQKKSTEKDKIQGIVRKKVTKQPETAPATIDQNEFEEVTATKQTTDRSDMETTHDYAEDEFYDDLDDFEEYGTTSATNKSTAIKTNASKSTENHHDEFESDEEYHDSFGKGVLGKDDDEFE